MLLSSVINVIDNISNNFNIEINYELFEFIDKLIQKLDDSIYILVLNNNNIDSYYLCYKKSNSNSNSNSNSKIITLDKLDYVIYSTLIYDKSIDDRINNIIINSTNFIKDLDGDTLKKHLLYIHYNYYFNDIFFNNYNKLENDQSGGFLIKLIEDGLDNMKNPVPGMLFGGFLEFIDFILMIASAIPVVGMPFDVASIIFFLLRGDIIGAIASAIEFVPVIGDVAGTGIKVVTKFFRIMGKISKYSKKFKNKNIKKFLKKNKKNIKNIKKTSKHIMDGYDAYQNIKEQYN